MTPRTTRPQGLQRVAFYGTLRLPGVRQRLGVSDQLTREGPCVLPGRLLDLGGYPGLVLDPRGRVTGALFGIRAPQLLDVLDDYEGVDRAHPARSLFVRQTITLLQPRVRAWVYVYNRDPSGVVEIESGDWLRRPPSR